MLLAKSACWKNYEVSVDLVDYKTHESLARYELPKTENGEKVIKKTFPCTPAQQVYLSAKFSPPIWQNQKDKAYRSIQIWQIPTQALGAHSKLKLQACFAKDFANVPMPTTGDVSHCSCDFTIKAVAKDNEKNRGEASE